MNLPLQINENLIIPAEQIQVSAVRSSGPGGQNVNKVSTCIELRFNPANCDLISSSLCQKLLKLAGKRTDAEGNIIVTSQRYREQYRNLIDAYDKLKKMFLKAMKPVKPRKPTKPSRAAKERRIKHKKQKGEKKANRRKPKIEDY
jgi:ribosome-associated protein